MNAEIQTPVNVSRGPVRDGIVRATVLRSTLLGEYASLLLMAHALFGVIWWTAAIPKNLAALIMVPSGLWIAFRAVGGFAGEKSTAAVSVLMLIMTGVLAITGVSRVPEWMTGSIIAPIVSTIMLALLLIVEFLDGRARSYVGLTNPERRQRDGVALKLAFVGLFLAWGLGVPMVKAIDRASHPVPEKLAMERMSFIEEAGFRCGEAMVTACFFALGANIGSFLNVVVWRMPLGKSIVHGDSRCPVCSTKIASRDNIPIFGWLGLGGQCRACGTEISPRYPIVEAITGTVFLLFYFAELISGGANLPVRGINMYRGVLWIIMYPKWDLIGLYLFHCFLFCVLLVLTLMALDRSRIPRRLLAGTLIFGFLAPVIFTSLQLVPVWTHSVEQPFKLWGTSYGPVLFGFCGGMVGVGVGLFLHILESRCMAELPNVRDVAIAGFCLVGVALGWQAVLSIMIVYQILAPILSLTLFRREQRSAVVAGTLLTAVLVHHLSWRLQWLYLGSWWPGETATFPSVAAPLLALCLPVIMNRKKLWKCAGRNET